MDKFKCFLNKQLDFSKHTILIVDEAHQVKQYKTLRSQKVTTLSKITAKTWFLTGTPLLNHPFDLWGILNAGNMARDVFSWNVFIKLFT
jgi:SNF2 family DNA or RNA helicase